MKTQSIMFSAHRRTKEVHLGLEMSKCQGGIFGSRAEFNLRTKPSPRDVC